MEALAQQLAAAIQKRLFIELEASGRHVHLTKAAAQTLFGHSLTPDRPLSQPGQFVAKERVSLITPKGRFDRVAVLGPERKDCQVELSKTDCVALGLNVPIRLSGDNKNTPGIVIANGDRVVTLQSGVIVAQRHLHMTPEDAEKHGVKNGDTVRLRVLTDRPLVFDRVAGRVSPDFRTYAHLDFDEANACDLHKGDLGMILCRRS